MSAEILRTRHRIVTRCVTPTGAIGANADPEAIVCFRIGGDVALALHRATRLAGPFLAGPEQGIRKLELSDTNKTDHHAVRLNAKYGIAFESLP